MKRIIKQISTFAVAALIGCLSARGDTVVVSNDVASVETWYSTNTYQLQKIVYVQTNAVLVIEPGTVIKAATSNLISSPGVPVDCAALWVQRGGKLYATGTVSSPIIFTFDGDDVTNPNDVAYNTMGKWGGIVLCGKAQINSAADASGNVASPKYEVFEGTTGGLEQHKFGGSDDSDSSGALKYVSIRYPGIVFAPAKELNGLSLGGVGSGTEIEYVEVFNSADDGFEFFGGNVNTKHLISAFCDDDDFDTDMGYRGTNQFWFGIKPTWTGSSDSRGFETDGDLSQTGYPGGNATPVSSWYVYNATLIGRGKNANTAAMGGGWGWNARDEARPNVFNSTFTEFNQGVLVDADGLNEFVTGVSSLGNSVLNTTNAYSANATFIGTNNNSQLDPLLGGISYTNNAGLNPRPLVGSPLLTNVLAGAPTSVSYRGAFGRYDNWANGWTALSAMGNLAAPAVDPNVTVSSDILSGTTVTWYATNTYTMSKIVYVQTNAVLVIEPGTVIKAATSNLISSPGVPVDCAALWVQRGGKLYATGTVSSPIIFTFDGDDVTNPNDVAYNTMGKWGGIVLCGKAQINSAADASGNVASPKYEVFEGTTGGLEQHKFGGSDDSDSSGALKYVSIRYPGIVFAPAKELNGLSLGGVGSGTEIEYVEVFNSADDGFEFFGGNVNTKHLISAFCDDDDFDTDMGYRGTNQFWFGIKPTWTGSSDSRGFETDGDLSQTGYPGGNATPVSSWYVYNATLIGRGKNANTAAMGGGWGWNARDEARPNVFNSTFTEFNQGVLVDADGLNEFVTGVSSLGNSVLNTTNAYSANATFIGTNNNSQLDPLLGGISYTNNAGLNPRPLVGSPLLTNVLAGAPTSVSYRGAFSANDIWADCWTALAQGGFLSVSAPELTIQQVGGNVEVTWSGLPCHTYQLQSTTSLNDPVVWGDEGAAQVGTGVNITVSVPATGEKFFRVNQY